MLWEIVPPTKGRFAVGETCFLLEGGCGRADTDGDNFNMIAISVSLFGDVCKRALSERCERDILYIFF